MSSKRGSSGRTGRGGGSTFRRFSSEVDGQAYGDSISNAWEDGLSPEEKAAVQRYKEGSATLNSGLRDGTALGREGRLTRDGLDSALAKASLPDDIVVMRGIRRNYVDQLRGSEVVTDLGYMSTTGSREVARGFSAPSGYIIEINVPRGSRGMYVDNSRHNRGEFSETEFLFARGSRLRIRGIDDTNRTIDAVLEQ